MVTTISIGGYAPGRRTQCPSPAKLSEHLSECRGCRTRRWSGRFPVSNAHSGPNQALLGRAQLALLGHSSGFLLGFGWRVKRTAEQNPRKNRSGPDRASPTTAGRQWCGPTQGPSGSHPVLPAWALHGPRLGPDERPAWACPTTAQSANSPSSYACNVALFGLCCGMPDLEPQI